MKVSDCGNEIWKSKRETENFQHLRSLWSSCPYRQKKLDRSYPPRPLLLHLQSLLLILLRCCCSCHGKQDRWRMSLLSSSFLPSPTSESHWHNLNKSQLLQELKFVSFQLWKYREEHIKIIIQLEALKQLISI